MKQNELIPGEAYILDILNQPTATFEGRQSGAVAVFDESGIPITLGGYAGWLRFLTVDNPRIVFVPDGSKVVESAHAKAERERAEAARRDVYEEALEDAMGLLDAYGVKVGDSEKEVWLVGNPSSLTTSDDFEIDQFTIGHLRQIIGAVIVDQKLATQ